MLGTTHCKIDDCLFLVSVSLSTLRFFVVMTLELQKLTKSVMSLGHGVHRSSPNKTDPFEEIGVSSAIRDRGADF